ncbi:MAG: heavy-metal-associated domain-containing protein [Bacteroidota bacterium]
MNKVFKVFSFLMLLNIGLQAQVIEAKIKTSGQCEHCKETLEKNLRFEKGVKKVTFDIESQVVSVKFDQAKTSIKNIQVAITKLGYDADSLHADTKAYERLNACCKKKE